MNSSVHEHVSRRQTTKVRAHEIKINNFDDAVHHLRFFKCPK